MIEHLMHVGWSHHSAPLSVREACATDRARLPAMLQELKAVADEGAILSTCSRFELYVISRRHDPEYWKQTLAHLQRRRHDGLAPYLQASSAAAAAHRLLRVAAGLDSQVIGEDHIAQQVRQAFELAHQAGTCGPTLSAVFRAAIHAGRRVRRETPVNRVPRSFAHLAIEHLGGRPAAQRSNLLVLGSGFLAREVVEALDPGQRSGLHIVGRNLVRARQLAEQVDAAAVPLADLERCCRAADAVFACTCAPRYLITPAHIRSDGCPQVLYDLGMPRNIDPIVGCAAGVDLWHLEDLAPHRRAHDQTVHAAERTIGDELAKLIEWFHRRESTAPRPCAGGDAKEGLAA